MNQDTNPEPIRSKRDLTWNEFIDLDFAYAIPKAKNREQSEDLWKMNCNMNQGEWKFILDGDDMPTSGRAFLSSTINHSEHTVHLSFEPETPRNV